MDKKLNVLEKRVSVIEDRNKKVELDKAWEISWTRRITLSVLTYFVIVILMWSFELSNPFVNSLVPAIALLFAGPTLNMFKTLWVRVFGSRI